MNRPELKTTGLEWKDGGEWRRPPVLLGLPQPAQPALPACLSAALLSHCLLPPVSPVPCSPATPTAPPAPPPACAFPLLSLSLSCAFPSCTPTASLLPRYHGSFIVTARRLLRAPVLPAQRARTASDNRYDLPAWQRRATLPRIWQAFSLCILAVAAASARSWLPARAAPAAPRQQPAAAHNRLPWMLVEHTTFYRPSSLPPKHFYLPA